MYTVQYLKALTAVKGISREWERLLKFNILPSIILMHPGAPESREGIERKLYVIMDVNVF